MSGTGSLARRLAALERRADVLAAWWGKPLSQWPDAALEAAISRELGCPPGHLPSDEELRALQAGWAAEAAAEDAAAGASAGRQ